MNVCGVNANCIFGGKFIKTPALEKYHKGLSDSKKVVYNTQKTFIESVNDGKEYVYDVYGRYPMYAAIYERNMSGTQEKFLTVFSDFVNRSEDLFDSLYARYKMKTKNSPRKV